MDGTNHCVTQAVPMVSHIVCSTVHTLGTIRMCGQAFLFRIWSKIVCLQWFMAWLIYYGVVFAAPGLQRIFSELCQDLASNFSIVFKNLCLSFLHFLPAQDAWLWQEDAWHSRRKQPVCASVHMHTHSKEIPSLGTLSTGSWRLPVSNRSTQQMLAGCSHKALCNASQQLYALAPFFFTAFSLYTVCRKGWLWQDSHLSCAIDVLFHHS